MEEKFMKEAIKLAIKAFRLDEIPVGAVIVKDGKIIGKGYNKKEKTKNPLKHAELIAIEKASKNVGDWRLNGCEMYITYEPCQMCMGAINEARIDKVVYGASKNEQLYNNEKVIKTNLIKIEEKCLHLLQTFFQNKRNK